MKQALTGYTGHGPQKKICSDRDAIKKTLLKAYSSILQFLLQFYTEVR